FYSKVVQHQLLVYELWQRHERPRPVYLCLDNSGSMSGEKEVWAKASALALAHMALQHGRSVEIVLFGDAADPLRLVPLDPRDAGDELAAQFASTFLERASGAGPRSRTRPRADRTQPLVFDHFLPEEP